MREETLATRGARRVRLFCGTLLLLAGTLLLVVRGLEWLGL